MISDIFELCSLSLLIWHLETDVDLEVTTWCRVLVLKCNIHQNHLECSLNVLLSPIPRVSGPVGLDLDPQICISSKFPDDTDVPGPGTAV